MIARAAAATRVLLSLLPFLFVNQFVFGAAAAPPAERATIDDCQYADDAAAQAVWKPMGGTAPVRAAVLDGAKVLRLPCNLAGTKLERASWDREVKLDLSSARGVQFKLLCRDLSPVRYFGLYFQSGEGWYRATFFPESSGEWNTITVDKAAAASKGNPAGWGRIKALRLSAWRGKDADTEFFLRDMRQIGVLGVDAAVAIVRGESAAPRSPETARDVERYAEAIAQHLRALEVGCAVVSDQDLAAESLAGAKLAVLPYNPALPERAADELVKYVNRGGKLLVFYCVPDKLRPLLGVEGGKHVPAPSPGYFSTIRFATNALPGAPTVVTQQSWNINAFQAVPGAGRVLAQWHEAKGEPVGCAAVLGSTNGIVMTHVLLSDDPGNKRRMLLALAGCLAPELWQQATGASIARIGALGGFRSFDEAVAGIAKLGGDDARVTEAIASAGALRASAMALAAQRQFAQAMEQAVAASQQITDAFCRAQQPLAGEFRAFWCHSAFGVQGLEWDEAIGRLATNGFTAILPNLLWGGVAFYDSKVLPVAPEVAKRGDQVAQCLAACRRHGLQIHVWKVNWNLGHTAPKEFRDKLRAQGRLQADSRGAEEPWLCPSHPDNQQLEIASMVELARNYDLDGLHFDYIRYPDGDHCFCPGCKQRFQQAAGVTLQNWPGDVLADGPLRQQWLEWRRSNITAVVKAVSEQARALKPKLKLSAAVFSNWPTDRDNVGQDWKLWCEQGYLDFVCPMDYTPSNRSFENMITQQVEWAGRTPCYPGIGASASSSRLGADRVIEQINLTRQHNTRGFVIFNYGVSECNDLLPLLGLGVTASR
jgi:uncharacterized lipoprotein YddW (UPF0748 family)